MIGAIVIIGYVVLVVTLGPIGLAAALAHAAMLLLFIRRK